MTLQPLRKNRDFVLLQVGQTLSTIGSESTGIAYPLLVLAVTHSPVEAGVVGFARVLPWGLFGFLAGVATDRFKRKRMMIVSDIVRAGAVTSIVVAVSLHRLTFAQIAIVAFVEGSMYVFFNVAEIGALRAVVPSRQLPAAAAAEQARYSTVTIVAPPLGGSLFGIGRAFPFLADAISYVFSFASLLAIRTPFQEERAYETAPVRTQIAEGFRWLWGHKFLRTCAVLFTWVNVVFEGTFLVLIVVGRRQGLSGAEIGALIAAIGFVALAGSLASPRLQKRLSMRQFVLAGLWLQLSMVAFVVKPSIYALLVGTIPAAFVGPSVNAVIIGYRLAIVPDRLTGRVNSVARTIALLGMPLGPLSAGLLLGWFSARATVGVYMCLVLLLCVIATLSPSIRHAPTLDEIDDLPTPEASPVIVG
ncbi:MAG TPA: MFS transporter [Gaiellaceae bacterium]